MVTLEIMSIIFHNQDNRDIWHELVDASSKVQVDDAADD